MHRACLQPKTEILTPDQQRDELYGLDAFPQMWIGPLIPGSRQPQLDFVRFRSGPSPEDAVFSDMVEGLIEWQDASAHIVNIFPLSPV